MLIFHPKNLRRRPTVKQALKFHKSKFKISWVDKTGQTSADKTVNERIRHCGSLTRLLAGATVYYYYHSKNPHNHIPFYLSINAVTFQLSGFSFKLS